MDIRQIIKEIILNIEGFYSNHPNDYGGETVYGIARKFNPNWKGWNIVDNNRNNLSKVKDILLDLAIDFYYDKYFLPIKPVFDLKVKSGIFLFDWYINSGNYAIKELQKVLNVKVDSIIGKETLAAINKFSDDDLLLELILQRMSFYIRIILSDKSQLVFLLGWFNRIKKILGVIKKYVKR